jgi:PelA/Pel-15E family pectate lyase
MRADKVALAAERAGMSEVPAMPKEGFSGRAIPLGKDAAFYRSDEGRRIGDVIVSFQTPAGGWSKNLAMDALRARGQSYTANNLSKYPGADDFDTPKDPSWNYVGTLDNDATNTELKYLAKMAGAWPGREGDAYRKSFLRGVEYLLKAQYPNGGWPQVWPLEGGYHDAVTFNDNAVTESAETLTKVAAGARVGDEDYGFVPQGVRVRAMRAAGRALECVLRAQVVVGTDRRPIHADDKTVVMNGAPGSEGVLTVWAQQYDPLTLKPVSARNFEPAALSSGESADVMAWLMSLPQPSERVKRAIDAAGTWFEANKIMGYTWSGGRQTPGGRKLTAVDGAGPLWARYYSLQTGRPIFGDRDKTIHDDVMELSLERRNGYAWYSAGPEEVLERWKSRDKR